MKELSVEEKARRYDEALKVLHKYDGANIMFSQSLKEEIFPELKESEDERIRKEIIDAIRHSVNSIPADKFNTWIAWLEKKGESDETKAKMFLINKGYPIDTNGIFPTYEEMYYIIKDGLEKQDKTIDTLSPQEAMDIAVAKCFDEQKPANKVEPKFKVGDWTINTESGYIRQILKINNGCYETDYGVLPIKDYESIFRLWNIQNAREGEVLAFSYASQNYILIYKRLYKKGLETKMSVFCFYCVEKDTYYDGTDSFHVMNHKEVITPATKEQCDTLERAMADAGYAFDFKKKELKKIEQKPAWSALDERNLQGIIAEIEANKNQAPDYDIETYDRFLSWLKSLSPQSTWKPSDEQMKALDGICSYIRNKADWEISQDMVSDLYKLSEQLKKLKG